jgi:hypothetical protein
MCSSARQARAAVPTPKKRRVKPLQQGALDGFCGIYSLFNAVRIVEPRLSVGVCHSLFVSCLLALEERRDVAAINMLGLGVRDLMYLSRAIFSPAFGVVHARPFVGAKPSSLGRLWGTFEDILSSPAPVAIITAVEAEGWAHWTVVEAIDADTLWLADSDKLKNVLRKEASIVKVSDQRPVMIRWKDTLVIRRDPALAKEMELSEARDEADSDEGWEAELAEACS